jgi:hypothetical protein
MLNFYSRSPRRLREGSRVSLASGDRFITSVPLSSLILRGSVVLYAQTTLFSSASAENDGLAIMISTISPYPMRSTVTQQDGVLRISIPAAKNTLAILFASFWLCIWTIAGISVAQQWIGKGGSAHPFFTPKVGHYHHVGPGSAAQPPSSLDSSKGFWMCGWAVGEILVAFWLGRMLGGRDIFQTANGTATIRREIFGLRLSLKQYTLQEMRNLRYQPGTRSPNSERPSGIAFDYGSRTVFFGDGADETEANQLIEMILSRQTGRQASNNNNKDRSQSHGQAAASASSPFWRGN